MAAATSVKGDATLFGRMMRGIDPGHTWGNRLRMLKLPMILTDTKLYAGAICQFYLLTRTLEQLLAKHPDDPLVCRIRNLELKVTPGYEADLRQLLGGDDTWREKAEQLCTPATRAYCDVLQRSSPAELAAASFILYGALVVGGGKATQRKVKKVFPSCDHMLFDVNEDMPKIKREFKELYAKIGEDYPDLSAAMVADASRFMALNNTVVLSVRCTPYWWWKAAAATMAMSALVLFVVRRRGDSQRKLA